MIKSYKDLEIYKLSLSLAKETYVLTKKFPKEEIFGITDQLRRASASVGANIAEGFGRYHYKDRLKFMYMARGSAYEVGHFLELTEGIGYLLESEKSDLLHKLDVLSIKLNNFIHSIKKNDKYL